MICLGTSHNNWRFALNFLSAKESSAKKASKKIEPEVNPGSIFVCSVL